MATPKRYPFPGELALLVGLMCNSLAVTLIIRSGMGLSVVSGVPYVLSLILPVLSVGLWNAVMQCAWLLVLMLVLRRFRPGYIASFVLAILFGYLLDFWAWALAGLPDPLALRILYFAGGYLSMCTGVSFMIRCKLPVLPFDTVPREFILVKQVPVRIARTGFDLINLVLMLALGLICLGYPAGIGVGTIFNALLMGTGTGFIVDFLDRHLDIQPKIAFLGRLV